MSEDIYADTDIPSVLIDKGLELLEQGCAECGAKKGEKTLGVIILGDVMFCTCPGCLARISEQVMALFTLPTTGGIQ